MTKIMVVDDEMLICQLLMYQLSGAGYDVCMVQGGREALERLLQEQPDLVILDVMMPQMSGWDICRQIRACSTVPVIMLTGKSSETDIITGLKVGADDYMAKPFSMPQLLARVEAVLRRARPTIPPHRSDSTAAPACDRGVRYTAPSQSRSDSAAPVSDPHLRYTTEVFLMSDMPATSLQAEKPEKAAHASTPVDHSRGSSALRLGRRFYEQRKQRGLSLHQIERMCGVRWEFLQALEQENFGYMPRAQLRHALKTYSAFLELDLKEFVGGPPPPAQRRWPVPLAMVATVVLVLVVMFSLHLF